MPYAWRRNAGPVMIPVCGLAPRPVKASDSVWSRSEAAWVRPWSPVYRTGRAPKPQRRTCSDPGFTILVGVPLMKFTTLSNAAPKYSS